MCFDPVGGDLFDEALSSLDWGGRFVHFGFVGGVPKIPANRLLVKHRTAAGSSLRYFRWRKPDLLARSGEGAGGLLAGRPPEADRHPQRCRWSRGVEAMQLLTQRKAAGKVVVTVQDLG